MVIQIAQQDFQLTDNYVAPKGSLVVPSVWSACMQASAPPPPPSSHACCSRWLPHTNPARRADARAARRLRCSVHRAASRPVARSSIAPPRGLARAFACVAQGYEKPESFDPDRFSPERQEDVKFAGNYLVFGHGPHVSAAARLLLLLALPCARCCPVAATTTLTPRSVPCA